MDKGRLKGRMTEWKNRWMSGCHACMLGIDGQIGNWVWTVTTAGVTYSFMGNLSVLTR